MSKRSKYSSKASKLMILKRIEEGEPVAWICKEYGKSESTIRRWRNFVQTGQEDALTESRTWNRYSAELKEHAVKDYLDGKGSQSDIANKYGLRSIKQLHDWIWKYTEGKRLKPTSGGRNQMASRKTTLEERIQIASYCVEHDCNYSETARLYEVSYQQVYGWVKKWLEGGDQALVDRRGKAKEASHLTEEDKLRIELRKMKKANRELEVENALLKKLQELERM